MKVFLAKVIEGLDVGPNATRVGVVNYASRVKNEVEGRLVGNSGFWGRSRGHAAVLPRRSP